MNQFELLNILDVARLVPLLLVLAYAGYKDYKTGEVSNKVWLYTPIGAAFLWIETLLFSVNMWPIVLASSIICVLISLGMFEFTQRTKISFIKDGWGGADTKALMMVALSYPLAPAYLAWMPFYPVLVFGVAGAIAVFVMVAKRSSEVRFLPYFFFGLIVLALI